MEEDGKKAGLVCSYKQCKNKSYSGAHEFYRLPQDIERNNFALGLESKSNHVQVANMRALEWEDELAFVAGCNLKLCQEEAREDRCHRTGGFPLVGQNVETGVGVEDCAKHTYDVMIKEWYEEIANVGNDLWEAWQTSYYWRLRTDRFSQVIWAETSHIGCALSSFTTNESRTCLLVCNYGPAGNIYGKRVYRMGTPTSACPPGVRASKIYKGLCGNASPREATVLLTFALYIIVVEDNVYE